MKPIFIPNPKVRREGDERFFLVRIEGEEYVACEQAAANMWCSRDIDTYTQGVGNRNPDDPHQVERAGFLGEVAVAKILDTEADLSYKKGGDKYDLLVNGNTLDVKCAKDRSHGKNYLRYDRIGRKDYYVAAAVDDEERAEKWAIVAVFGWMSYKNLIQRPTHAQIHGHEFSNYELRWVTGDGELNPIETLKEKLDECLTGRV